MSFTSTEVSEAGYSALDYHVRKKATDNVSYDHPFLRKLKDKQKSFPGGKQYVTEPVRKSLDSNFQWYRGDQTVTYNRKQTLRRAQYEWGSAHDGFFLDEDRLAQNGIDIDDNMKPGNFSGAERNQLLNLFEEQMDTLMTGFDEVFEYNLLQDGTQDTEAIDGLDKLLQAVTTTNQTASTNVRGGLDSSTEVDHNSNAYWYNQAALDVTEANLVETLEQEWRKCTRNGGTPDFILAGSTFVDSFRDATKSEVSRYIVTSDGQADKMDPSVTGLAFKNVPIIWCPAFEQLDADLSPTQEWESRAYFINTNHLRLRPMAGHDMRTRKPPRAYNRYVWYWGVTWKGALCTDRLNAHGVVTVTGA